MDTLTDSLKKLLVRGIFMGMFAILLFRAVGTTNLRVKHSITQTLTEHWNGSKWAVVPSPDPQGDGLNKVSVISSTNVWAVGGTSQGTLILNYSC